ncbi:MAG: Type II secretion system protein E [Candidatus Moranbacteria bacterium GW2011_GWE1_36_7]|nr:MAG: Type II secretion system protein E [Candidatus Moranbacteria bacterium GW2011_GWD2_36_12]KKQ07003.1 MAG: Type II secretion system protein E [Candidatus Moranbacteria bacterium GW2011_GWE2_36_40]KKQ15607.1 MAG: Type II secretion system protein E [Candidatus Moranbacteria bacterium GW2011_GWE1_36_7]
MRIENKQLRDFLLDSSLLDVKMVDENFEEAEKGNQKLGDLLMSKKLINEIELRKLYSYILGIPFVNLEKETIASDILQIIPEPIAKKYEIIAFEKVGNDLKVAMKNPEDLQTIDFIRKKTGLKIVPCLTTEESIRAILKQYEKSLKAEFGDIISKNSEDVDSGAGSDDLEKIAQDLPIIRIVDTLLKHAILQSASDIHVEPGEKEVHVRYRIDGVLHEAMTLPRQVLDGLVARIKVLSNLKLDEHRLPQDGRFKIEKDGYKISFRVSMLPVFEGEKIVMRLLDETSKGLTLEKMGLNGNALEAVHRHIKRPNGMVLVTGPTGSGKTTTLYTIMDILNTPEVNISTVEDPVEYRMVRVNQTQTNAKIGMTFAAALRALLRQDPDIIMVGEIRDGETMQIAVEAAMTGHLVLSTLHTNSAAGTLPRLLDMGAEAFLVASTVNVIIGQRLVRKLCNECKVAYNLGEKEVKALSANFEMSEILEMLKKVEDLGGTINSKSNWKNISFYRPKGCEQCSNEGYHGRLGIYEVLEMNEIIGKLITSNASSDDIEKKARENGMRTMGEDGFIKAVQGITSIEEVMRVTKE